MFCNAKYRGGVRRTEGVKNTHSKGNELRCHPLPLPSPVALRGTTKQYKEKAAFQSSSPVFCNANIGEVSAGRRGKKLERRNIIRIWHDNNIWFRFSKITPKIIPANHQVRYSPRLLHSFYRLGTNTGCITGNRQIPNSRDTQMRRV